MRADRVGHRRRLALLQRVVAAHHPLQLREFPDHPAHEIGLAQGSRPLAEPPVKTRHVRRQGSDELAQPFGLLPDAAELGVEDDRLQRRQPILQPGLAVLVPEELGVGQARPQHALVAGDDRLAAVGCHHVGHDDEARRQAAVRREQREIFLMRAHRGRQHLGRHRHEGRIDRPGQDHGPFDQPGDLAQQRVILLQGQPLVGGKPQRVAQDDLPPLGRVEDHVGGTQAVAILLEAAHPRSRRARGNGARASRHRTPATPARRPTA